MTIFFTSDPHFGHERILEFEPRPWDNIPDMNQGLIDRWNSVVTEDDTVFVLGDVIMGGFDNHSWVINELSGYKVLVSGNHDKTFHSPNAPEKQVNKAARSAVKYREAGFAEVIVGPAQERVAVGDRTVTVCHFPYEGDHMEEDRYQSSRPDDRGGWLVHGHVHGMWRVNGRQINVGVDVWNGYPVHEDTIMNIITGVDTNTDPIAWSA